MHRPAGLAEETSALRTRSLADKAVPYLLWPHLREGPGGARVVSRALVVATVIGEDREVPGIAIGDSEDAAFWVLLGFVWVSFTDHAKFVVGS
ncbi:MAG: hypothetical protein ACRDVC_07440 [Acidimicrobiales bacterium]